MGEVKQMQTPQSKYASMTRDELILVKAGIEQRLHEAKAKHKHLDTKPYQMRSGQDRVTLQRVELDITKIRGEYGAVNAALSALKERRREESATDQARTVEAAGQRVQSAGVASNEAARLKNELEAAYSKLRWAEHAIEFMAVARLVLAESTFGRIKARASDNVRLRKART